jgi:hypothetical protein
MCSVLCKAAVYLLTRTDRGVAKLIALRGWITSEYRGQSATIVSRVGNRNWWRYENSNKGEQREALQVMPALNHT